MSNKSSRATRRHWRSGLLLCLSTAIGVCVAWAAANPVPAIVTLPVSYEATAGSGANGIIRSGPLNHAIVMTSSGTSLNIVTSLMHDGGPIDDLWDFNFFRASAGDNIGNLMLYQIVPARYAVDGSGHAKVFELGDVISSSTAFSTGEESLAMAAQWLGGTDGYLGVEFNCDGRLANPVGPPGICYGYVHLTTAAPNGFPARIKDTAFNGDGQPITVESVPPSPDPVAYITPLSLHSTIEAGTTGSDIMVIGNIGGSVLAYSIAESETFDPNPPSYKTAAMAKANAQPFASPFALVDARMQGFNGFGEPVILDETMIGQMSDNAPGDEGVSCGVAGSRTGDNSWWRRFYFSEHPQIGASANITRVTVSSGSSIVPGGLPVTINLYTIAHSTPVDTIPTSGLTLIGSHNGVISDGLASVTIPVTGTVIDTVGKDLVVEYHTEGSDLGQFFPGADATTGAHPAFLSSTACGVDQPTTAAALGFPDFHLKMVVETGGTPPLAACDNPSDIPWLSTSPGSGTVAPGESRNVVATADAAGLGEGHYSANLCVNTNDPLQPLITVPFRLTVLPAASIFCNGFEMDEDPYCGTPPPPGDIVYSGPVNVSIPETNDGLFINYLTGQASPTEIPGYDFDPYLGRGILLFFWGGSFTGQFNAGVAATTSGPYLVLGSGDTIGPSSTFSSYANGENDETRHFLAGVTGYLGVMFTSEKTGQVLYGYVHIQTTAGTGFPATILDYAYDDSGAAITIP